MIKDFEVNVKMSAPNIGYYLGLGYEASFGNVISIKIEDIPKKSNIKVNVVCDICSIDKLVIYNAYNRYLDKSPDGKYRCNKCNSSLRKETCIKKHGVDHYSKTNDFKGKRRSTIIERYGVEHYNKLDIFKEKIIKSNIDKYGVSYPMQSEYIKDKYNKTCIERYGETSPIKYIEIKDKILDTMMLRYGVKYSMQSPDISAKIVKSSSNTKIEKIQLNNSNILNIDYDNNLYLVRCDICKSNYDITPHMFTMRRKSNTTICTKCNEVNSGKSGCENLLFEYIKEIYSGEIVIGSRNIISPYELDIYLPDLNIAFEFNGLYWHSNIFKEKKYHKMKSDMCESIGIQLIHIWEDDWTYKNEIIKSVIKSKLNITDKKIYARKCEIRILNDNKLIRMFLDNNHLQGFVGSSIKLGLFNNNELVGLMTFGHGRKITNSVKIKDCYELIRFCNKINTSVVGGASKIFSFFIKNYKPDTIISYADRSYSNGNLYEKLGFEFYSKTEPNYYYIINGVRVYRFNFRKDVLVSQGYDKNKSESDIMFERGINKIYNSGNFKYIYKIKVNNE